MPYRLGLPTSSSQCVMGGIVGVGMMDGWKKGVNWKLFSKQVSPCLTAGGPKHDTACASAV